MAGHEAKTVLEMEWAGKDNGELIALTTGLFDVFLTVDRNLAFQQRTKNLALRIVVLSATSKRLEDLRPLMPRVADAARLTPSRQLCILRYDGP